MRAASPALTALLATRNFVMSDLFSFQPVGGAEVNLCSSQMAVVTNGAVSYFTGSPPVLSADQTVFSSQFPISRGQFSWKVGIDVDTAELTLFPIPTDLINGYPWLRAVNLGFLDCADVVISRAFAPAWTWPKTNITGTVVMFSGRIAGQTAGRSTGIVIDVNSYVELLNIQMPRNLYQAGCLHTLYDTGCGVSRAAFTSAATVDAGATLMSVPIAGIAQADGYYDQGVLTLDNGLTRRTVKKWAGNVATLVVPLYALPAPGTAVSLILGCDKQQATCTNTFNNVANFRAMPFIPAPETSVSL